MGEMIFVRNKDEKLLDMRVKVLRSFCFNKSLSIYDVSLLLDRSLPSTTSVVNFLLEKKLLKVDEFAKSTGGRRAKKYIINNEMAIYTLGVAVDQLVTRVSLFNLRNDVVENFTYKKEINISNNRQSLTELIVFLKECIDKMGLKGDELLGVGIAMPGFVNVNKGSNVTFFGLGGESVGDFIAKELALPVFLENDSSAIALAEKNYGVAKELQDVMVVNVGWGIGLGMIVDGNIFRGHNGLAGEFSHIPLGDSKELCTCGKRGCLEVDCSLLVLARQAREELAKGVKSQMKVLFEDPSLSEDEILFKAANRGDQLAIRLLSKAGFIIGKGIATLIHIMNPQTVVISGRGGAVSQILIAPIQQAVNEFCIPFLAAQCQIMASELNEDAELLGASCCVINQDHILKTILN